MTKIKLSLGWFLLALTVSWLLADTLIPQPFTYFSFRTVFVQYTGVIAIGVMSVAMLLAVRPVLIERPLNGLDKMYRLHKWLGITALVFAVIHWWFVTGTKWMVGWGWLIKPERKPRIAQILPPLEQWFRNQRGLAESLGEWAFYAAVILIAIALIKRVPYRLFKKIHLLLAVAYLVLAFHAMILIKYEYWSQTIGWIMLPLLVGGTISAVLVLTGRVGAGRKSQGVIETIHYYPGVRVIEGTIRVNDTWNGHSAGQFAFVTSNKSEGAHPYTIASAWDAETRQLTFISKELGDWTRLLRERLKVGMPVTIEGPYGCFDFSDDNTRQIWIGAGIGITPFIARMKHLAKVPDTKQIDLFHATSDYDEAAIEKLNADAAAAGVKLHLIVTPQHGRLTAEQVRTLVPDWRLASVWYCGPNAFAQHLHKDFIANGMHAKNFHQELFEMR
jgi:predicted ferric reductase